MTENEWVGIGIFIVGLALLFAGVWLKGGPELAMIVGGAGLAYAGARVAD